MRRATVLQRLGAISVQQFMRRYWQRKPLLIRQALPDFNAPVDRKRLFELARNRNIESRLISLRGGRWSLQQGPFARLPSTRGREWTLLVQGVDLHNDAARELLSRFRFVPDARLDDLMVSYATDGGSVGPHVDSYDVFLLQASGRRRWRISRQRGLRLMDAPINVLQNFRASNEWMLDAGDMLYLPPGVAHEGVAVGECLTYSIGFRAASYQQLLEPWFADYAERAAPRGRYADPAAAATARAALLPPAMMHQVHAQLARYQPGIGDTERFLLRYLTEPKATTFFEPSRSTLSGAQFRRQGVAHGLKLDRKSRLIYSSSAIGINGEWIKPPAGSIATLKTLADQRALSSRSTMRLPAAAWSLLHGWYRAGWIAIAD